MAFKSLKTKQKLLESSENNIFSRFFQPFPTTIWFSRFDKSLGLSWFHKLLIWFHRKNVSTNRAPTERDEITKFLRQAPVKHFALIFSVLIPPHLTAIAIRPSYFDRINKGLPGHHWRFRSRRTGRRSTLSPYGSEYEKEEPLINFSWPCIYVLLHKYNWSLRLRISSRISGSHLVNVVNLAAFEELVPTASAIKPTYSTHIYSGATASAQNGRSRP